MGATEATMMGKWMHRFRRRRDDAEAGGESKTGPPDLTLEQADEIKALLDEMVGKHGEERARVRRRLRRKGMHIGDFPDVDDWSASAFDRLVSEGRIKVSDEGDAGAI